ncbi:TPA: DUF417 family protein [Vibrio vulnificus]|uniref:YkgB family protein n=1 Tax=Vibrio vulnificus TaxID=672 RepID=UPI0013021C41|nr:DUF417 family protein [Vibrio vulnificus]MCU8205078.1 YkgB family protein [Vibrio vulnificus]HAS8422275.1 DUF417 family protein [Vibrio vulnificus]
MSTLINTHQNRSEFAHSLNQFADQAVRFSIVIVLAWIGAMKFTSYEAGAIEGLVASSPLTSWLYSVFSLQGASNLIGFVEVATAVALLLAPVHRGFAILGAASATLTFTVTTSFLFTAPIAEASLGGFPAISVVPGQFLLKDIVLLSAALSLLAKALLRDE